MNKRRILILEKIKKNRFRPNNGCVKINYLDNPMPEEERNKIIKQGIKIIDVEYV